jgi:hypothetical protein
VGEVPGGVRARVPPRRTRRGARETSGGGGGTVDGLASARVRLFERFDAEEAFSTLTTMHRALRFDACRNASRTKRAKHSPNAKVQVHVVFCYTIEVHATRQSVDAHQSINSFRRPFFSRLS